MMNFSGMLIVADEQQVADHLAMNLRQLGYSIQGVVLRGEDALAYIKQNPVDLIFMSMSLEGQLNGIETVEIINKIWPIPIIYMIQHMAPNIIEQLQQTRHTYILPQSHNLSMLQATLANVAATFNKGSQDFLIKDKKRYDCLFLRKKDSYVKVNIADIQWIKGAGAFIEMVTLKEGKFVLSLNLRQFLSKCPHPELMRVHRSYIVNLCNVEEVIGRQLVLGDQLIPYSEFFVPDISEVLPIVRR